MESPVNETNCTQCALHLGGRSLQRRFCDTLSGLEDAAKHHVIGNNVSETQGQGLDGAAALD